MPEDDVGDEIGAIETDGDVETDEDMDEGGSDDSEDLYEQVKQQRAAKLTAKAAIYSRFVSALWYHKT